MITIKGKELFTKIVENKKCECKHCVCKFQFSCTTCKCCFKKHLEKSITIDTTKTDIVIEI